ncbi:hypothetical protein CAPTEDRAFT_195274 [Capitella teleta]|uniref:Uncharacterized protein n=1 Tax=Capitella teleta TaxID=283909 RepID=R7TU26_CAPTE|nr:hypothetical protein CAPTEDRAFT_195274 [Capitella teleta]|eukprot:ELT94961.1 hypothetical protein CAPTEDRAFT_195274 [Capitella teleta]
MGKQGNPVVYPPQLQPQEAEPLRDLTQLAPPPPQQQQQQQQPVQTYCVQTEEPVQSTRSKKSCCAIATQVASVLSIIGILAGAVMTGLGDPEELDDLDEGEMEAVLFLAGVILLVVSFLVMCISLGFCCYYSKKYGAASKSPTFVMTTSRPPPRSFVDEPHEGTRYVIPVQQVPQVAYAPQPPQYPKQVEHPPSSPPAYSSEPQNCGSKTVDEYRKFAMSTISERSEGEGALYEEITNLPSAPPHYEPLRK